MTSSSIAHLADRDNVILICSVRSEAHFRMTEQRMRVNSNLACALSATRKEALGLNCYDYY